MVKVEFFFCKICGNRLEKQYITCPICGSYNKVAPLDRTRLSFSGEDLKKITTSPREVWYTRIPEIDKVLGEALGSRSLFILAGPEGGGKTTLAYQISYRLALQGIKSLYISSLCLDMLIRGNFLMRLPYLILKS